MAKRTPSTSSWGKTTAAKRYAFGGATSVGTYGVPNAPQGSAGSDKVQIPSQQPNPQLIGMNRLLGEPPTNANPNMGGISTQPQISPLNNTGIATQPGLQNVSPQPAIRPQPAPPMINPTLPPANLPVAGDPSQRRLDRREARRKMWEGHQMARSEDGWNGRKSGGRVNKGKKNG